MGEYRKNKRKIEECIPEPLEAGKEYRFLKKGQRFYWLHGELPLLKTEGEEKLSPPIASVEISSVTHTLIGDDVWTSGLYKVREVFTDAKPHFNGYAKL